MLCESLENNITSIVAEWKRLTDKPPWTSLTDSQRIDHLPPLLRAMIEGAVCGPGSHEARLHVVESAIKHGEQRRAVGFPLEAIFDEHSFLRMATWRFLTRETKSLSHSGIVAEIIRLDAAIGIATLASLRGFHRAEFERIRDWNGVISDLVTE